MSGDKKRAAAAAALRLVTDGMRLGIGTGSTAEAFIDVLGDAAAAGLRVSGVPTSERTERICRDRNIPLTTLDETPELDLTIDGADEIGPSLGLIKGGGGALLREKIVAASSAAMVVIADDSKVVEALGRFPLPIEIVGFGARATIAKIEALAEKSGTPAKAALRRVGGEPYVTDSGNLLVDASFGRIRDAEALAEGLSRIPGVVEHGLFLGLAQKAIVGGEEGVFELDA